MNKTITYKIIEASSQADISAAKKLFSEYAEWLEFPLCFQNFDEELASLPGKYTPPNGRLYLVKDGDKYIGCIALREFSDYVCEMKRLFVQPEYHGKGIGKKLVELIINEAKKIGYKTMRLDTIKEKMPTAVDIYKKHGFKEIEAYYQNPNPHTLYMELELK